MDKRSLTVKLLEDVIRKFAEPPMWDVYSVQKQYVMLDCLPNMVSIVVFYNASRDAVLWQTYNRALKCWLMHEPSVVVKPVQEQVEEWKRLLTQHPITPFAIDI